MVNALFSTPADQNFDSLQNLIDSAQIDCDTSIEIKEKSGNITFSNDDTGNFYLHSGGNKYRLVSLSLRQAINMSDGMNVSIANKLYAKGRYDLIVANLNALFPTSTFYDKLLLVAQNHVLRSINGNGYSRLWDANFFSELGDILTPRGFEPSLNGRATGMRQLKAFNGSFWHNRGSALFRSNESSFGFFFAKDQNNIAANLGGLTPGIVAWNSEVGERSFMHYTFYMHEATGAIIPWKSSKHARKRYVHRGNISNGFAEFLDVLEDTADHFASRYTDDVRLFETLHTMQFATSIDDTMEKLNTKYKMPAVNAKAVVHMVYDCANKSSADSVTIWELIVGICAQATITGNANSLVDDSMIAAKIIQGYSK